METINNMASAAAKAVWGDQSNKEEPVSGKTGNTAAGEPYDAGNLEEQPSAKQNGNTTTTTTRTATSASTSNDDAGLDNKTNGNTTTTSSASDDSLDNSNKSAVTKTPGDVDEDGEEEVKIDGPGPRPLEEIAREHGGDAGKMDERKGSLVPPKDPNDVLETTAQEDDESSSQDKGDGTKYMRSSGLKADGGDFDATKPGAGREADRLLEEKGIHPLSNGATNGSSTSGLQSTDSASSGGSPVKEKKRLSQRIKEKLHSH